MHTIIIAALNTKCVPPDSKQISILSIFFWCLVQMGYIPDLSPLYER